MALPDEFDRAVDLADPEVGNDRDVVPRRLLVSRVHEALIADDRSGVELGLAFVDDWSSDLPRTGEGRTSEAWSVLATLGAHDLQTARTVEPDLDARTILREAGVEPCGTRGAFGVYAAEGPRGRLVAAGGQVGWTLTGVKPWCSLAERVDRALVTAWQGERRRLYAVDLTHAGVRSEPGQRWVARGLPEVSSTALIFDNVPVTPVGAPGWYLERPGFAWGGIGVAAVWFGGAVRIVRELAAAASRRTPDQIALLHLGAADASLHAARLALLDAAAEVDSGRMRADAAATLAARVRHIVFDAAESILRRADHALGPGPLALDPDYAAHVADLHLYLRQHHAERDSAALGQHIARSADG